MRLSHKRKVAHKRSGAAKGWARVVRARHIFRETVMACAEAAAAEWVHKMNCAWEFNVPGAVVCDDKPKRSLIARGVSLVKGAFSRLKAAGEAQRNLLQGRQ